MPSFSLFPELESNHAFSEEHDTWDNCEYEEGFGELIDGYVIDDSGGEEDAAHEKKHDTLTSYSFPEMSLSFFHHN